MIRGGKGGSKTQTGIRFEERINLSLAISKINGYSVAGNYIIKGERKIAEIFTKNKLYKNLLEPLEIDYLKYISKKLLPDEAILIDKTLYIIEMKFQYVAGSVDEKLQTCDFKKKQYDKLFSDTDIKVEYVYVLNDWFKKAEYKDVLQYIKYVGCHYFFNEIPLSKLGL
ncbi:MAG: hypothetical protein KGL95_13245 [Patescibacteria group bacterium]|nr:hypothetical protein [Patescibacteria group bacterium]